MLKITNARISRIEDSTIQRLLRGTKIIDFKRAYVCAYLLCKGYTYRIMNKMDDSRNSVHIHSDRLHTQVGKYVV